jgi:chorismate lyase/3-hydroxybenzoate synthase
MFDFPNSSLQNKLMPMPAAVTDEPQILVQFGEKVSRISGSEDAGVLQLGVPWLAGKKQEVVALPKGRAGKSGNLITLENDSHLVGAATIDVSTRMEEPVHQIYREVLEACASRGMHLHRAWNYVPRINEVDHGLERYRQFNIGRWLAFEESFGRDLRSFMPAASAVGSEGNQFAVMFVAGKTQPQYLENPSQVPAYHYPADYGPRPPSFARAVLVKCSRETVGYLSGTASIEGHRNVGEGDWHLQFRTTMHNIQIMFERMGMAQALTPKSRGSQSKLVMRDFKVYLRHPEALPLVQEWLAEETGLAGDDVMFLKADICRAELDLEMEAVVSRRIG